MYVERVPNRNSRPTYLIREGKRVGKKVVKTTLANITKLPDEVIEQIRILLKGGVAVDAFEDAFSIKHSPAHGHVAAVLGVLQDLRLAELVDDRNSRYRRLALAMIAARVLRPSSKLATSASLDVRTASDTLNEELQLKRVDQNDLYEAMDWLHERKGEIEARLAKRHLTEGALVMCDMSSTWVEGEANELAEFGYSRDRKKGKKQIVFGLLTDAEGAPVAVDVFKGNTADPQTLSPQIKKLQQTFKLKRVVLVGDRGLLTEARLREDVRLDYITALRKRSIRRIVNQEGLQLSLFDERNLAEIRTDAYPGERIVLCRNPLRADKSKEDREALLQKTEAALEKIARATRRKRNPLRSEKAIALRVGKVIGRWKMEKHIQFDIREGHFSYRRNEASIRQEQTLDGLYAIRASVKEPSDTEIVQTYKRLSAVEAAFRCMKTVSLRVRPIHHYRVRRVESHIFLCMLAYYVEYHLRRRLAPMLFAEHDPTGKQAKQECVVESTARSESAEQKARTQKTPDGLPVMSFPTLMQHLALLKRHVVEPNVPMKEPCTFTQLGERTPIQIKAFELLGVKVR